MAKAAKETKPVLISKDNAEAKFKAIGLDFVATANGGKVGKVSWKWIGDTPRLPPSAFKALRDKEPKFLEAYPPAEKKAPKPKPPEAGGKGGEDGRKARKITTVEQLAGYSVADLEALAKLIEPAKRLKATETERTSLEATIKAMEELSAASVEELRARLEALKTVDKVPEIF